MEKNRDHNFISAIVYCHNKEQSIYSFLEHLEKYLSEEFYKYEIIIVDDGSIDNSEEIIRRYVAQTKTNKTTLLKLSYEQGLESAMLSGVDLSIGDFVYEFDVIFNNIDKGILRDLYQCSLSGYDIVCARINQGLKKSTKLFYCLFNRYARLEYKIGADVVRILSRRAINRVRSTTESIPFRKVAYANCGLPLKTISFTPDLSFEIIIKEPNKLDSLILYTDIAYRITIGLAIIMAITAVSFACYALFYKILSNPVEGWATTIIFIASGFWGLFTIQAMVIKYLQTILNLAFKKKEYIFESIEKLQ